MGAPINFQTQAWKDPGSNPGRLKNFPRQLIPHSMAEPPRPSQVVDVLTDADALIRLAMTPPPAQRQKRHFSVHTPSSSHSSTSLAEPLQGPEELLISTLAAIEGDEMSYDVFQFVIEMVRGPLGAL